MVFSTYLFIFWFLLVALGVYALLPNRHRNLWLAFVSYVFYGWFRPRYCLLLLATTLFNYYCGRRIAESEEPRRRKFFVTLSVVGSLGLLGFFKYAGMLSEWLDNGLSLLLGSADGEQVVPILNVVLPIGISFFIFQAISYTVDIYRGHAKPAKNLISFAAYIAMFPQLVAGPIVRYQTVAESLRDRRHGVDKVLLGVRFFILGLAKKVLLADSFGLLVPLAFGPQTPEFGAAWVGVLAYSLQIYFDFSAYSDMAVGLGLFLGFSFPQNFDSPYKSGSITEFWRRWHISLSTWLRDYLYFPLGGNRHGPWKTYRNLFLVMLLGGLWHGASVMFLIWGAWHGVLLAVERWLGPAHPLRKLPRPVTVALTTFLVVLGWVPFRSESMEQVGHVFSAMFRPDTSWMLHSLPAGSMVVAWLVPVFVAICWIAPNSWDLVRDLRFSRLVRDSLLSAVLILIVLSQRESPFLYFQF